jgi:uncharacterized protein YlxW (UPF0749 family)
MLCFKLFVYPQIQFSIFRYKLVLELMADKKIVLRTPKYHPVTGVELDGDYGFEFESSEEQSRIQELLLENDSFKNQNRDLRYKANDYEKKFSYLKETYETLMKQEEGRKKLAAMKRNLMKNKKKLLEIIRGLKEN